MAACRIFEDPILLGQMPVQDTKVVSGGGDVTVTKYGIGARGIDVITKKVNSGSETFGFPLYDVHGNMVATLARSGSNSYSTGNTVEYDVWGGTRSGSSTVDQKYCANLGHRSDAENGLQYMRARYYDPSAGRFVNKDPAKNGPNWYTYAGNNPMNLVDATGEFSQWETEIIRLFALALDTLADAMLISGGVLAVVSGACDAWQGVLYGTLIFGFGMYLKLKPIEAATALFCVAMWARGEYDYVQKGKRTGIRGGLIIPGLLLMGTVGLMFLGLLLGANEGDADNWVWGLP